MTGNCSCSLSLQINTFFFKQTYISPIKFNFVLYPAKPLFLSHCFGSGNVRSYKLLLSYSTWWDMYNASCFTQIGEMTTGSSSAPDQTRSLRWVMPCPRASAEQCKRAKAREQRYKCLCCSRTQETGTEGAEVCAARHTLCLCFVAATYSQGWWYVMCRVGAHGHQRSRSLPSTMGWPSRSSIQTLGEHVRCRWYSEYNSKRP